jgi:hypothetical protein
MSSERRLVDGTGSDRRGYFGQMLLVVVVHTLDVTVGPPLTAEASKVTRTVMMSVRNFRF